MRVLMGRARSAAASIGSGAWIAAMAILPIVVAACGNNNGNGY